MDPNQQAKPQPGAHYGFHQGVQAPIQSQPQAQAFYVQQAPLNVGPNPSHIQCPSCKAQILTRMDYEATGRTHLAALILCCFVCWPCAWIPYVMDSCKNANHYCPACNSYIGTYKS